MEEARRLHFVSVSWPCASLLDAAVTWGGRQEGGGRPTVISQQPKPVFSKSLSSSPLKENTTSTHCSLHHHLRGEKHRESLDEESQELFWLRVIPGEPLSWFKTQVAFDFSEEDAV